MNRSDSAGPPPVRKADYERLAAFRYCLRRFLRFSEQAAQAAGLTPHQHQALLAIQGMPGRDHATVGELAERLQIRPNTALELASRLIRGGWLRRSVSPADQRAVRLRLTPAGIRKLELLTAAHREELKRVGPGLRNALADASVDRE